MNEYKEQDWEGEEFYRVEKILDFKEQQGKVYYLVKWQGWDVKTSTWEEEINLRHLSSMIKKFHHSRRKDQGCNAYHKGMTKIEAGMSPYEATNNHGHVLYGDTPKRVIKLEVVQVKGKPTTFLEVEWGEREDGYIPHSSMMESKILAEFYPEFVFEFYYSKVKLLPKQN